MAINHLPDKTGNSLINFSLINAIIMSLISLSISTESLISLEGLYRLIGLLIQFSVMSLLLVAFIGLIGWIYSPLRKILSIILFAIAQLIVIANLQIYSLYHFHINGMVFNLVTSGALLENIAFSWLMWISLLGIFTIVLLIESIIYHGLQKKLRFAQYSKIKFFVLFFTILISFALLNGIADAKGWNLISQQNRYIPWQPPITMRKQLARLGMSIETQNNPSLKVKVSGLNYPLEPLDCSQKQPLNILFIIVDSLRFDMLTQEVMPFTYQLESQAISFKKHFSGGSSTRYGMFNLFYGLPGSYWHPMLDAERGSVLFDQTIAMQYQHFIYGSTRLTFPEFDRTFFSALRNQLNKGSLDNSAENDADITQRLIQDIKQRDPEKPFLGFVFYDSPHAYSLPENYPNIFSPRLQQVNYLALDNEYDPTPFLNLYKSTAHYVDTQIKELMKVMQEQQLIANSLIVITSDHGQEFNESAQNFWGHNSNFSKWQTQVPLLLLWPNKPNTTYSHLTSHEDLIPSIMQELFGCSTAINQYSTGQSLFDASNTHRSLLMESWNDRAIFYQDHLFFVDLTNGGKVLDAEYKPVKKKNIPGKVLQENLNNMSRFLKH
jgi:uncharacterized protein